MKHFSLLLLFLISCAPKSSKYMIEDKADYEIQNIKWKNWRIKTLTAPEGWLSVVGLYWLKEGRNTLGSMDKATIHLDEFGNAQTADIILNEGEVIFESGAESFITMDGDRFVSGRLNTDADGSPSKLAFKSLIFYVIERGGRYALRVKNTLADARYRLKEIPNYPINYDLIVEADVKYIKSKKIIPVIDSKGIEQDFRVEAILEFYLDGKKRKLLAFDGGAENYFIAFTDNTNGVETNGGGRYLYPERSSADSMKCILDFNRASNPPCVFTDFATCPIPPVENHLDLDVRAGEQDKDLH